MFRVKFEPVEARRIDAEDYDGMAAILEWCGGRPLGESNGDGQSVMAIPDGRGQELWARPGDWIVHEGDDFYPCAPDVFDDTFEAADTAPVVERIVEYVDSLYSVADQLEELGKRLDSDDLADGVRFYRLVAQDLLVILNGGELRKFVVEGELP